MAAELQSLMNDLVLILASNIHDPSKVQKWKVESVTSQLGGSSHTSEVLYDLYHSRAASRMSGGQARTERSTTIHSHTGELETNCSQTLMPEDLWPSSEPSEKRNGLWPAPHSQREWQCWYRGLGEKQEPNLADKRVCDLHQIRTKVGMGSCPHRVLHIAGSNAE